MKIRGHHTSRGPMVSFDRPELSPCLARFRAKTTPEYAESLAIIEAGKDMLAQRPRADMPDFTPCRKDLEREDRYEIRRIAEARNWEAIRNGKKVYDARSAKITP